MSADTPTPNPAPTPAPRPSSGGALRAARRLSREFAVQGLYEWLLTGHDLGVIEAHLREDEDFARCDAPLFARLMAGCTADRVAIDVHLARHGARRPDELSPVEHAVLLVSVWELLNAPEIPYRVVINEGIELAKAFGGTDGHRYVNGVLDQAARSLRSVEVQAAASEPRAARTPRQPPR